MKIPYATTTASAAIRFSRTLMVEVVQVTMLIFMYHIHTYIMQNWQSDGVIKWNKVAKISLQPPWWKIIILKFILLHECASECMIYYDANEMYCRLHAQTLFMNQIHEWKLFSHWHSKKKCARKNQLAIEIMRQIK